MTNDEIWKNIYLNNAYQVSNLGRIRFLDNKNNITYINFLFTKDNEPYIFINKVKITIKKLVALHFIPNPKKYKYVLHLDGDTKNNKTSNLKWYDGKKDDLKTKYQFKKVKQIDVQTKQVIAKYLTVDIASKINGIDKCDIYACCNNEIELIGNYKWQFA